MLATFISRTVSPEFRKDYVAKKYKKAGTSVGICVSLEMKGDHRALRNQNTITSYNKNATLKIQSEFSSPLSRQGLFWKKQK